MNSTHVELAKSKSILNYLNWNGINIQQKGNKHFCSSPFASDREPSFCIYPNNTFYDFSTGIGGDIIDLVRKLENKTFQEAVDSLINGNNGTAKIIRSISQPKKRPFVLKTYLLTDEEAKQPIIKYANSRGITKAFACGKYFEMVDEKWIERHALAFIHVDEELNPCGIKFRRIDPNAKPRFSARGTLKFYILNNMIEDSFDDLIVYIVESETSANSFWEYLRMLKKNAVVISFGGVNSVPEKLPEPFEGVRRKLIIDYDGNEEKYLDRISKYEHLNVEPVKLMLDKGEDLNSLFVKNKMYLINNLI